MYKREKIRSLERRKKMKDWISKIVIGYLIASIVLMTGCGNGQSAKKAMGRYVEQDIEMPDGAYLGIFQDSDGKVLLGAETEENITIYSLQEDNKWKEEKKLEANKLQDIGQVLDSELVEDGIIRVCNNANGEVQINKVTYDGAETNVTLSDENGTCKSEDGDYFTVLQTVDGDYIVQDEWGGAVKSYDGTTGKIKNQYGDSAIDFKVKGKQIYANTMMPKSSINIYDINTGNQLESIEYPIMDGDNKIAIEDKGIYLFNSKGIQFKTNKGEIWETIMEPEMTKFNQINLSLMKVFTLPNDQFVIVFDGQEGPEIKQYTYDPNIPSRPEKEVTVYMGYDVDLIRQAISIYQKKHSDVYVNIKNIDPSMNYEDAITSLNTEILAGGGPDLLVLDDLPIDKYIEKGVLTDISDIVANYTTGQEGYKNILSAYQKENKVYAIPLRFRVPLLWGKAEVVDEAQSIHELAEYRRKHPDEILFNKNMVELYNQIYDISALEVLDENGKYSKEKLKTYIEDLEVICVDKKNEEENERIDFEPQKFPELLDVAEGKSQVFVLEPRSSYDITGAEAVLNARGDGAVAPFKIDGKGIYVPQGVMGINANSKNQDIVKEIINIALSDEVEGIGNWLGLPPSEKQMKLQEQKIIGFTNAITDDSGRRVELAQSLGSYYLQCKQAYKEASICRKRDSRLVNIIGNAIVEYSENRKPLDEVLDEVDKQLEMKDKEE